MSFKKIIFMIIPFLILFFIMFIKFIPYEKMPNIDIDYLYDSNLKREYNDLLRLVDIDYNYDYSYTYAKVIYHDYLKLKKELIISKGQKDNLKEYMPVIYDNNLVGYISDVYEKNSTVKLLCHDEFILSIIVNNEYGFIKVSNGQMYLQDINNASEGDRVYTSGLGHVISDIYVGSVVKENDHILVESEVDFTKLYYLVIIKMVNA